LAKVCRNEINVQEYGENLDVIWKTDSTAIAVLVSFFLILLLLLLAGEGRSNFILLD